MIHTGWDDIASDNKEVDNIVTFIIFCEDGKHEPEYFKSFAIEDLLRINIIERQGHSLINYFNAVNYCRDNGIMETVDGIDKLKDDVTENIWCVYDRDQNRNHANRKEREDAEFDIAIKTATDAGLKVAWSNDFFELWVLLHFEKMSADAKLFRDDIYARLTYIMQHLPQPSTMLNQLIKKENFYYKKHLKPYFAGEVLPLLKERVNIALENAVALEKLYPHTIAFHDRNPCTMVHHLVKELLSYHAE